ncbi:MAG: hypothetical protein JWN98_273 [Abditibacteriota bacterium]|nr:hypothetical protein [Abditibacteriota bacterium]
MRTGNSTPAMTTMTSSRLPLYSRPSLWWAVLGVATLGLGSHNVQAAPSGQAVIGAKRVAAKTVRADAATNAGLAATVRLPRGGRITLPYSGVTQVVADDIDVARASFSAGKAVIEGITVGTTAIEVFTGNVRQLLSVQVLEPTDQLQASFTPLGGATAPDVTPAAPDGPITLNGDGSISAPPANTQALPQPVASTGTIAAAPVRSPHNLSVRVSPVEDNPLQALVTITYTNRAATNQNVNVRYVLDDLVSYVTNSATGGPQYDAASRELTWKLQGVSSNEPQALSFRVEPVERNPVSFNSVATVQGEGDLRTVSSNPLKYSFTTTPLLTVFALPDRFLAGRNAPVLVDVRGDEFQSAIDRLQKMGVLDGVASGIFRPTKPTQRAEYAVMTLRGLNVRDLRDVTAIKFVLSRRSTVSLNIVNSRNQVVAPLVKTQTFEPGEKTVLWDGRSGSGYAPPGRYTYVCTARDARGEVTVLKGNISIVPQTPLEPSGKSSFVDVKKSDWFAGYLSIAEKQDLVKGYPGRLFRPYKSISRVEATAMVVRALGLEDLAKRAGNKDVGFLDYQDIPNWAIGYVNVASTVAKTQGGRLIMGYPSNLFMPNKNLRRDEAALIVQRLIDKETNRRVSVSGQLAPGAIVTINNRTVEAQDDGQFSFVIEQNSDPVTVAVLDARNSF